MSKAVLKVGVALLTFLLGVGLVSLWIIKRASHQHEYSVVLLGEPPVMPPASLPCSIQEHRFSGKQEDIETVRKLLAAGVDVNGTMDGCVPGEPFPRGVTLLMQESGSGSTEIVKLLLDSGAEVNLRDNYGDDALMYAAGGGHVDVMSLLLERGADINTRGFGGLTPLMAASENGEFEAARYLIDKGAEINAKDPNGTTALMFAAGFRHPAVIDLLLNDGADPKPKDKGGRTFEHYKRFGYPKEYFIGLE